MLQGGVLSALDQLTLARKSPDATFYDQAQIDARERELQKRRREELGEKGKKELAEKQGQQGNGFSVSAGSQNNHVPPDPFTRAISPWRLNGERTKE